MVDIQFKKKVYSDFDDLTLSQKMQRHQTLANALNAYGTAIEVAKRKGNPSEEINQKMHELDFEFLRLTQQVQKELTNKIVVTLSGMPEHQFIVQEYQADTGCLILHRLFDQNAINLTDMKF